MDQEIKKMLQVGEVLKEICEDKDIILMPLDGYGVVYISAYNAERKDFDVYELFRSAKDLAKNILGFWLFCELCELLPSGSPSEANGVEPEDMLVDLKFAPPEEAERVRQQYEAYIERISTVLGTMINRSELFVNRKTGGITPETFLG